MKKSAVLLSLLACAAFVFATPAGAATNPFMDVPLNHWAYAAIGQLAARGVLSGYPDGTYKGKQPTTRYEMASALARALAVVDMTKASKQDVEMLKKLVVEFKDELDALGVKVDQLDKRVAVLEDRLGGWKIGGDLRMDLEAWDDDGENNGDAYLSHARLEIQRWFGEDETIHFYTRIKDSEDGSDNTLRFDKFYVEAPVWWDMTMTVGRFGPDFESDYRFQIPGFTDSANESWLTDRTVTGMQFQKSFGLGSVSFYAAHPGDLPGWTSDTTFDMWELLGIAQLQFNERFGFDFGVQAFLGDDSSVTDYTLADGSTGEFKVDNLWTAFAGLKFNFNRDIALKGLYYYQDSSMKYSYGSGDWNDYDLGNTNAWKVLLDVKQDLLKFTSLWLEYDQLDQGFYMPYSNVALTLIDTSRWNTRDGGAGFLANDTKIWRVGALQRWNDQWSSWVYVAGHTLDNGGLTSRGNASDAKLLQWGVGVEYLYRPNIGFALNYINADWDDDANRAGYRDESRINFRTGVSF